MSVEAPSLPSTHAPQLLVAPTLHHKNDLQYPLQIMAINPPHGPRLERSRPPLRERG